jgi:hypothetical protein
VLERGEVANSWRRERWDSLRLLTPNWQAGLPGAPYEGHDPDGYMTTGELVEVIARFAVRARAPVRTRTDVTSLRRTDDGYRVATSDGEIDARTVVIASGACNRPAVPAFADALPADVEQLTPFEYRNPTELPDGGVLVQPHARNLLRGGEDREGDRQVVARALLPQACGCEVDGYAPTRELQLGGRDPAADARARLGPRRPRRRRRVRRPVAGRRRGGRRGRRRAARGAA